MVSYKAMYEQLLKEKKEHESVYSPTGYKCPLCGAEIILSGQEFICKNDDCRYDKIALEVFYEYANYREYEEIK